jgi:hypothetical protein
MRNFAGRAAILAECWQNRKKFSAAKVNAGGHEL